MSLRTILLAYKDIDKKEENELIEEKLIKNLVFLGLLGLKDPFREEIKNVFTEF